MRSAGPGKNAEKMRKNAEICGKLCGKMRFVHMAKFKRTFLAPGKQVNVFGMAVFEHDLQPSGILCKGPLISIRLPTQRKEPLHAFFRIFCMISAFSAQFWHTFFQPKIFPHIFSWPRIFAPLFRYHVLCPYFCTIFFVFWLWIPMQKCWHYIFCVDRIKQILFAHILKIMKKYSPGNVKVKNFAKSF